MMKGMEEVEWKYKEVAQQQKSTLVKNSEKIAFCVNHQLWRAAHTA